ncbi:MAG: M23 family metallopeptidase [Alphaproteobacteria bacterium]|nr:M23 family metallopeptidase [Alphaproteobacteria bacterium]
MSRAHIRTGATVLLVAVVGLTAAGCGRFSGWNPLTRSAPPRADSGPEQPPAPSSVVVQRGDTLYGIARRNRLPLRALITANKLSPPYAIRVGQTLVLPPSNFHQVRPGDTVISIARRYRVEVPAVIRANELKPPHVIVVGQSLTIPNAESPPPSPPPASGAAAAPSQPSPEPLASGPPPRGQAEARAESPPSRFIPKPPPRSGQAFLWPVSGKVVTRFGSLGDGIQNDGINIAVDKGTPVRAAENGVVVYVGNELKGFGNLLLIKHDEGWMTAYAHQDSVTVKRGQEVRRGDVVGRAGNTGSAPFPQLHFEVRRGTKAVDPMGLLAGGSA